MRAQVVIHRNPFDPLDRAAVEARRPYRVSRLAPRGRPVIARLNGRWIMRAEWRRKLGDGDHLAFHVLPEGGQGGGGSNPMQAVLSLALVAFAPMAAGAILGAGASAFATQLTTAGVMLAGSAVISALIPTTTPDQLPTPSPTYSLAAQGNQARLEQPIPVQYGRMRFTPDFAAQPYSEFAGSDQYLYQLFCLGSGEFDLEKIEIDDTDISAFPEIATQTVAPGGTVTLFPTAVSTSSEVGGQELVGRASGTYSQAGTTITVTQAAHGRIVGQAVNLSFGGGTAVDGVYIITVAGTNTFTVTAGSSASTSGAVSIATVIGGANGFVAVASGKLTTRLAVDVILPRGLFETSGSNVSSKTITFVVQARQVDDAGNPVGGWVTLGSETITDATTTPVRQSFGYSLGTAGRYAVRIFRTNAKDTASTSGHEILWSGLRAYLHAPATFGNVTLLAMRMRATNNLSAQASRLIRVTATRKVPVWNGSAWSAPVATRSIAWAIADAARNADYGAGRTDAQIDLAALLALDAVWSARGDVFDGRFDQSSTFWAALTKICGAGRAKPFMQGGVLRVVRDGAQAVPVSMFSMRNIARGSFGIDYLLTTDDTADSIRATYFDGTTWGPQRVTATLPGSTAAKPSKVDLFGITTRAQALREATYLAAVNRYRRRVVKFATEMDGFIPSIGDLIAVQHDMTGWGSQAEAIAYDAASRTLALSEPVTFGTGAHYLSMRKRDGSVSGPWVVRPGATAYQVVFAAAPDYLPYTGSDYDRTQCAFGAGSTWSALAKVLTVKPRGAHLCEIEAIVEDPSVHSAEIGVTADPITLSDLPKVLTRPVVKPFLARLHPADANRVLLSWEPVPGAASYHIEMAEGYDPAAYVGTWTRVADTTASHFTLSLISPYQTLVRIRAVGLATGDWTTAALGSLLGRFWSFDPLAVPWTAPNDPAWRPI